MTSNRAQVAAILAAAVLSPMVSAADVINVRRMNLGLARDIAEKAAELCRYDRYQVTAVVVDRNGIPQVMMRDVFASRFTIQIAEDKANAVILSGVSSREFRKNRDDIRPEMNHVSGILMLDGGVPVRAAGSLIGAVGVSGAPGGDKDELCARKALESVQERLDSVE